MIGNFLEKRPKIRKEVLWSRKILGRYFREFLEESLEIDPGPELAIPPEKLRC